MRKLVLGMSALALVASAAAYAQDEDNARIATAESITPSFGQLDADGDGRISAIEAATNQRVAAMFTAADANKDGYLSKAEYAQLQKMTRSGAASQSRSSREEQTPSDQSETTPARK